MCPIVHIPFFLMEIVTHGTFLIETLIKLNPDFPHSGFKWSNAIRGTSFTTSYFQDRLIRQLQSVCTYCLSKIFLKIIHVPYIPIFSIITKNIVSKLRISSHKCPWFNLLPQEIMVTKLEATKGNILPERRRRALLCQNEDERSSSQSFHISKHHHPISPCSSLNHSVKLPCAAPSILWVHIHITKLKKKNGGSRRARALPLQPAAQTK